MFRIGSHLSSSKGFLHMGREAVGIGANTFQFFTRNPRGGNAKKLDPADIAAYLEFARENGIGAIMAHASYTLNPASTEARLMKFVRETMADDLDRLENLPGTLYNFHPGSLGGKSVDAAIDAVAETLNVVLAHQGGTTVLLETMTGKSSLGATFEELRAIINKVENGDRLGVCLDTCHVYNAGYDIVSELDTVLKHFDSVVGLQRLQAVHLNDSKNPLGSRLDRHERIGHGTIGLEGFTRIINHPALRHLPFYLETPNDVKGYGEEIATLKKLYRPGKAKKKG